MYTVHEVAKLAHTTVKTLHHYHKIGLLIPEQTTEAGYRLYEKKDLERLQQILFYKELDFPLKEIKQLLNGEINRENTFDPAKIFTRTKNRSI
ncbi:MerR family transcriptional regulator [Paenibacillus lentus]|uniref:MerR family transcriptional regulator n=1 Tax=Paenibacillus lentus TaxID=1338368 RepID=UPI003662535B